MDTVLVVDDDKLFLALVREELKKAGLDVAVAETAPQAKAVLAQRPVQAIIMDVVMPDANGLELLPQFLWRCDSQQQHVALAFLHMQV